MGNAPDDRPNDSIVAPTVGLWQAKASQVVVVTYGPMPQGVFGSTIDAIGSRVESISVRLDGVCKRGKFEH